MPKLDPLTIIVRGKSDTGRTTVANFIKMALEENDFIDVKVEDQPPKPYDQKDRFADRLPRTQSRPIRIVVETIE